MRSQSDTMISGTFSSKIALDIFEFHLSYKDLDLDASEYIVGDFDAGLIVHAPELFVDSHLMDLCSENPNYRQFSIEQTQRVIDQTRYVPSFFQMKKSH